MTRETVERFIDALHRLERERDADTIAGLFLDDARVGNVVAGEAFEGREGAREFWTQYRAAFGGRVESRFRSVVVEGERAALEWVTEGEDSNGHEFRYEGVSVLELDGDRVSRFHAYFDPQALGLEARAATSR